MRWFLLLVLMGMAALYTGEGLAFLVVLAFLTTVYFFSAWIVSGGPGIFRKWE